MAQKLNDIGVQADQAIEIPDHAEKMLWVYCYPGD